MYINNTTYMEDNSKLTTVKILKELYSDFKKVSFNRGINLQKLVNRSMDIYLTDEEFRSILDKHTHLQTSGSQY
jgi:hypothetical protein